MLVLGRTFLEISPSIRHAYTAPADTRDGDPIVSTSEWNADHLAPDTEILDVPGGVLDPVPVGDSELFDVGNRGRKRLSRSVQFRIQTYVFDPAPAGALLKAQYTTDLTEASGWTDIGATVAIDAAGRKVSAWANLPAPVLAASEASLRWVVTA